MDLEQGFDLSDLTRMLHRRAWLVGGLALGFTLASIFIASILRNEYEATATLLVEPQTISPQLVEAGIEGRNINDRLHLIQMQILSRGRLSRVIDDLGLYQQESKELTREEIIEDMRGQIQLRPVLPELEEELQDTRRDIQINTFALSFRHYNRNTAAEVTNRLASDFIEEHIRERVEISGETSEFVEAELNRLAQRIADVEARIASIKGENAGSLPEDLESNYRLLERSLEGVRAAQRDLSIAQSDESFYRQQAASTGSYESERFARSDTSPSRRLDMLELQLNEYRSKGFTEKHPDMQQAASELEALRAQVAHDAEDDAEDEKDNPPSVAQQGAEAEAARAALRVRASQGEIDRLQEQIKDVEERIGRTPRVSEQLESLEREYEHLSHSYQDFSNKRLEAFVAANMERSQKGEQFRVLEAAYPPVDHVSPNRVLIIAMGVILGLLLGGAIALGLEFSDSSFGTARKLQSSLRIPVLAAVPSVVFASDRALARRRNLRRALAAVAVTGLVVAASVLGNWSVNGTPGAIKDLFGGGAAQAPAAAEQES